jgi:branched-chain amino acid transport system ATP-binding protein
VRDISFDIPRGSISGLIGPNGSGKTTVLNLITAEFPPDAGSIRFRGEELVGRRSFEVCRAHIARTFQLVRVLPGMTALENVMLGRMFGAEPTSPAIATRDAERLIARVGLGNQAHLYGSQLTYIDQKRVELARALATRPQLLLLDEWLAGLNPTELQVGIELIGQIRERRHHHRHDRACDGGDPRAVRYCVVMNAGEKIAEGTPHAVLSNPQVMQAYLGADITGDLGADDAAA